MKDNNTDYQNDNSCNNSNISLSMAVISVIATLLPIIIGLALWNKLPDGRQSVYIALNCLFIGELKAM